MAGTAGFEYPRQACWFQGLKDRWLGMFGGTSAVQSAGQLKILRAGAQHCRG